MFNIDNPDIKHLIRLFKDANDNGGIDKYRKEINRIVKEKGIRGDELDSFVKEQANKM